MDAQLKAKWVEALRGGKYKQASGVLHRPEQGFCCLGVLCAAMGASFVKGEHEDMWPVLGGGRLDAGNGDEYLGRHFLKQIGMDDADQFTLSQMNDNGKSFAEIADHIEKNL